MIAKQKIPVRVRIFLVLFDNVSEVILTEYLLKKSGEMTKKVLFVRGSTALLDAVGGATYGI